MPPDPNARRDKALESIASELTKQTRIFEALNVNLVHVGNLLKRAFPTETEEGSNAIE